MDGSGNPIYQTKNYSRESLFAQLNKHLLYRVHDSGVSGDLSDLFLLRCHCLVFLLLQVGGVRFLALAFLLLIVYGLMFLDNRLHIWSRFSLDYSTHTAVALALVAFLAINRPNQRYHTVLDIAVTGAVVAFPIWGG